VAPLGANDNDSGHGWISVRGPGRSLVAARRAGRTASRAPSPPAGGRSRRAEIHAAVVPEQRELVAHLRQPRDGAGGDLLAELVAIEDVGGDHDRALILIARIDDRVELLQHPVGLALRA